MHRGRVRDQPFLFGVTVEAGDGAQAAGHRGASSTAGFEVTAETFDIGTTRTEQRDLSFCAPLHPLPQVQLVRLKRQAAVAGEEPNPGLLLLGREHLVSHRNGRRNWNNLHFRPPRIPHENHLADH
jgi:hypothetical protein